MSDPQTQQLIDAACAVRLKAHAPFSRFLVGAALQTADGRIITGCNCESATYGLTICAERVAIFKALSDGITQAVRVVVVADTPTPTTPCGACRQWLWEFGGDLEVILANLEGEKARHRLSELLPYPFDAAVELTYLGMETKGRVLKERRPTMATSRPRQLDEVEFYQSAQAYLRSLPMEHYMEAYAQGFQRKITLATLDPISRILTNFHLFNEMLVQDRVGRNERLVQVVPDNMVVLYDGELTVDGSYDLPLQPARLFWVMEYVSKSNKRKDYVDNMKRYDRDLKVPYYLLFYPDNEELTLFRRGEKRYSTVRPNAHERYEIPELEIEMALLDGWVRYWFRGILQEMPAELHRELERLRAQLVSTRERLATVEDENARLRAEIDALRNRGA